MPKVIHTTRPYAYKLCSEANAMNNHHHERFMIKTGQQSAGLQLLVESYICIFHIYLVTLHFCIIFKKLLPGFQDCTNPKNEIHPHHEMFFYTRKWLRWLTWEQSRSPVTMRQNLGGRTGRQKIHRSAGYRSHPLQQFAHPANIAGGRNHSPW